MSLSDVERADQISRRRARMLPALAAAFLAGQPIFLARRGLLSAEVRDVAWLAWAIALLVALAVSGGLFAGAAVRGLVEDEAGRAHRRSGYVAGFWAAMVATVALYAVSLVANLKAPETVHLILTVAVAAALIRFGLLELRAHRVG